MTQKTRANFKTGQATTFADNSAGDISAADLRGEMDNIADSAIFPEDGAAIKTAYEAESDTNAYTDAEKSKLAAIEAGAEVNTVDSVAGETGAITAGDLRTAINVEDGAAADQSDAEIEAAYNNQVGAMSQATAEAGTSTTIERVTAQRIAQAIAAQAVSLPASPTNGDVLGWDTGALAWMSPLAISTLTEETTPASGMLFVIENAGALYKVDYDNMPSGGIADVVDDTTPQLGGDLDANGNDIDMGTNVITDTAVGQWNTAYGWGDHASAGYQAEPSEGAFANGDKDKLDGIEANATADQSDAEIEAAYNAQVAQVSGGEITAGTETAVRRLSPADVKAFVDTHAPAAPTAVSLNAQTGTSYTLVLTDAGKKVTMDNGAANTLTIPTNASAAFPVGTIISFVQIGAGVTTILGDTGVTLNGVSAGSAAIAAQFTGGTLVKLATDTWLVEGNLAAAVA